MINNFLFLTKHQRNSLSCRAI